jgi:3-methylcrotonyl-CoA carboxylase alpha subunit
MNLIL